MPHRRPGTPLRHSMQLREVPARGASVPRLRLATPRDIVV